MPKRQWTLLRKKAFFALVLRSGSQRPFLMQCNAHVPVLVTQNTPRIVELQTCHSIHLDTKTTLCNIMQHCATLHCICASVFPHGKISLLFYAIKYCHWIRIWNRVQCKKLKGVRTSLSMATSDFYINTTPILRIFDKIFFLVFLSKKKNTFQLQVSERYNLLTTSDLRSHFKNSRDLSFEMEKKNNKR